MGSSPERKGVEWEGPAAIPRGIGNTAAAAIPAAATNTSRRDALGFVASLFAPIAEVLHVFIFLRLDFHFVTLLSVERGHEPSILVAVLTNDV
jgi:hypothetical protein